MKRGYQKRKPYIEPPTPETPERYMGEAKVYINAAQVRFVQGDPVQALEHCRNAVEAITNAVKAMENA